MNIDGLLGALGGVPALPGASCRGESARFDEPPTGSTRLQIMDHNAAAVAICQRCMVFDRCARWLDGLDPRDRPAGVVAGRAGTTPAPAVPLRDEITAALRANPHVDNTELGRRLRCSPATIGSVRAGLEGAGLIPHVRRVGGRPRRQR